MIPSGQSGEFVANMEKVLDIYKLPYDPKHPVVCMDESPKQLIEDIALIPMEPGREKRVDYEYVRHGMVNIFIANEPLAGKRMVKITDRKTKKDWAAFINDVSQSYPKADRIILVMDNLLTHHLSAFYETFIPEEARRLRDRFDFVFTPKHGSWLNMAEIELRILNQQCLNRHIFCKDKIKGAVNAWAKKRNSKPSVINWQFTTENARIKLKRLYPSLSD